VLTRKMPNVKLRLSDLSDLSDLSNRSLSTWCAWCEVKASTYVGAEGEGGEDGGMVEAAAKAAADAAAVEAEIAAKVAADKAASDAAAKAKESAATTFDAEYVKGLREESAAHRMKTREAEKRAVEAEAKLKKIADAELSESERATKEAQEATERAVKAEAMLRNANLTLAVVKAAAKIGFLDPADAQAMLRLDDIVFDDGVPEAKSIEKQLEKLAKAKPYLLGDAKSGTGDGAGKKPVTPADKIKATQDDYAKKLKEQGYLPMPGS